SYEVFDFLTNRYSKMDLETITLPVVGDVPVFKPGDHEKLDDYMGITDPDHHEAPPADYNSTSGFHFYEPGTGPLKGNAEFSKTDLVAYADSVVLSKMLLLMESPAGDIVPGAGAAAGQLSKLYSDVLTDINGVPTAYDFSLLNLNGAHGGNVLTSTL